MAACDEPGAPPQDFRQSVAAMRAATLRPEVTWDEAPAPQRVAPYAAAMTADVIVDDAEVATGRLVLLHDPDGHESWHGTFRCVAYVRADCEPEMVGDSLLGTVAWSWLSEALEHHGAVFAAPSGTVTRVAAESFGAMSDEPPRAEIEIRASWTPAGTDIGAAMGAHVLAWGELLCTAAGLPPVPPGVVAIPKRRARD